jgi:hypothetical protein
VPRPILGDSLAADVDAKIDCDLGLGVQPNVVCQAAHARRCSTTGSARSSTSSRMSSWSASVPGCKLLALAIGLFVDVHYDACEADLQCGISTVAHGVTHSLFALFAAMACQCPRACSAEPRS